MSEQCAYCLNDAVRHDPFGQQPCCDECFNIIIGGEPDDPPWRCAHEPLLAGDPEGES